MPIPNILDYVLHIDTYLINFVSQYGIWTYLVLFLIIFSETGLVVLPFLPGDSLLFAVGSLSAQEQSGLNPFVLFFLLTTAAIIGNSVNYLMGKWIGDKVFAREKAWFFNKKQLDRSHAFYEKYGAITLVLARFIPVVRSFVPFVAGIAKMKAVTFTFYNVLGAVLWVGSLVGFGYFLGNVPFIKNHFSLVIYSIVIVSVLLPLVHALFVVFKDRKGKKNEVNGIKELN